MNTRTTHKIIAAGGMAAVIGIGVAVFFLRSTPVAPVARIEVPTAPVAEAPAAPPDAVAQVPAEPSPVAQAPAAATVAAPSNPVSRKDSERPFPAVADSKPARERKSASATNPVDVSTRTIARSETLATASDKPAATVAPDTVVASDTTPMTASAPTVSPDTGDSVKAVASDSQITAEVKSAIASEGLAKDASIGVTTTDGVVVLSGSVPSQAVVEQVKDVAAKIKDVKRVDISGLLASL